MKENEETEKAMNEYEKNKMKIAGYRKRSNTKLLRLLCNLMEWVNEKFLKEDQPHDCECGARPEIVRIAYHQEAGDPDHGSCIGGV